MFLKYEKLLRVPRPTARSGGHGGPLLAEVDGHKVSYQGLARTHHAFITVRTVRLAPGHYEY